MTNFVLQQWQSILIKRIKIEEKSKCINEKQASNVKRLSTKANHNVDKLRCVHGPGLFKLGDNEPCINRVESKCRISTNLSCVGPSLEGLQALHAVSVASGYCDDS
jgi:hypothetical protein